LEPLAVVDRWVVYVDIVKLDSTSNPDGTVPVRKLFWKVSALEIASADPDTAGQLALEG
jgi:hypothetical protein